jgi:hypothetical protein
MPAADRHTNGAAGEEAGCPASPAAPIFRAYERDVPALLLTGRSLYDLVVHEGGESVCTLLEHLRRHCRREYGMATLTYSLAGGLDWDAPRIDDERDRDTIETALRAHDLYDVEPDENEAVRILRGINSLAGAPTGSLRWADGQPMRFLFLIEFSEHLTPCLQQGGQTDQEIAAVELAHLLGQSLALRGSGNLVLFHGREGQIDELVTGALRSVRLPQPDQEEKQALLDVAGDLYTDACFEEGLDAEGAARLTTNTPNRGLEAQLRASHQSGEPITAGQLLERKSRDVEALSEQTLTTLDTRGVEDLDLQGRNVETPVDVLTRYGQALLEGNPHMEANVVLVGAPGTGKTDLAQLTARRAKASAYEMHSPKGSLVGETERKARLQMKALREWTPNVAFVDEITESLPLERSEFNGDSGASNAVTAALLSALADDSRRGESLLIGTTNCPWRMGEAMRSRFTMIPVLRPLLEDFPAIIAAVARRIVPDTSLAAGDPGVREAAQVFYRKGASPREVRSGLDSAMLMDGELTPDTVLRAARNLCPSADLESGIYADLWAVRACTSRRFLPWHGDPAGYPFPSYLKGVVDTQTGEIDYDALDERIQELKPQANV